MNYREIKCSDRLPEKSDEYLTHKGFATYDADNKNWIQHGLGGWQIARIGSWLEPYELPTEEEIAGILIDQMDWVSEGQVYNVAQDILNLLKGESNE